MAEQQFAFLVGDAEAGGNYKAKNKKSTATGKYQFIEDTWNRLKRRHPELNLPSFKAMPNDAAAQERAFKQHTANNKVKLEGSGQKATRRNLYLAHFLGVDAAIKVMKAPPGKSLRQILGRKAFEKIRKVNPTIIKKNMTASDMEKWSGSKVGGGMGFGDVESGKVKPRSRGDQSSPIYASAGIDTPPEEIQVAETPTKEDDLYQKRLGKHKLGLGPHPGSRRQKPKKQLTSSEIREAALPVEAPFDPPASEDMGSPVEAPFGVSEDPVKEGNFGGILKGLNATAFYYDGKFYSPGEGDNWIVDEQGGPCGIPDNQQPEPKVASAVNVPPGGGPI